MLIVHVTPFNRLMWDSGRSRTAVIEHGVVVPDHARYTGELERGIVVVNGLARRGRRLGADVFQHARRSVALDLVGMQSEDAGGLGGGAAHRAGRLPGPLPLPCEAMAVGLPIVALATTEMATVVENGVSGFVDTDVHRLVDRMHQLLADSDLARDLGLGARRTALRRFSIDRFAADWDATLREVAQGTMERTNSSTRAT